MIEELCRALGPGVQKESDLLQFRGVAEYEKDQDWPFNWLLITFVVRSVLARIQRDLTRGYYGEPLTDEATVELMRLRAGAIGWLERCRGLTPMDDVDPETKASFRSWWLNVTNTYGKLDRQVPTYVGTIAGDLGKAINHTIRCMATQDVDISDHAPSSYLTNLVRQNHWKTPTVHDGKYRHFNTALHQMLGYGSGPQDATEEHLEDTLLLQIQGELAFLDWHSNIGCVLHFWIDRDLLAQLDFSQVVATLQCD